MKTIVTVASVKELKTKEGKPFYALRGAEKNGEGQYEETTWWDITFFPGKVRENKADIDFSALHVGDLVSVSGVASAEMYKNKEGTEMANLKLKSTWIEVVARKGAGSKEKDSGKKGSKAVKEDDIPF